MRIFRPLCLDLLATAIFLTAVSAQWPTTCVELNDIVEAHLGNDGNVGIYQKVFGDQAEQACQNDHREYVRSVFAWAIGGEEPAMQPVPSTSRPTPTPAPTPAPSTGDNSVRISTGLFDQVIDMTFLEFRGGEDANALLRSATYSFDVPAAGEEYVAAKVRIHYISGAPGDNFLVQFTDFDFIQDDGSEGGYAYVGEAIRIDGLIRRGATREGWIAATVNAGTGLILRYGHSWQDSYVSFNLR